MLDTITAIATNNIGIGAINIIRISGEESFPIIQKIFSNPKIIDSPSHTIHYGYIKDQDQIIDEVLVTIMKSPKTYTKEDIVEINCHGGYAVTQKILELIITNGARLAEPGEFTKRAFLNGRINLLEAESVEDILESNTTTQRNLAINNLTGKTTKLITELREQIVGLLANIEVNIDYPEYTDELVITKQNIEPILTEINQKLTKIVNESQNGKLIKNGLKIAIVGKPNVGKSSLLNTLLEEEKAIVSNQSGTTRDIVEGTIIYKGILFQFLDTAGIRKTTDTIEQIGVKKSEQTMQNADITILVLNNNEPITNEEKQLLEKLQNQKHLIFINKTDLPTKIKIDENLKAIKGSTKTKEGIEELKEQIIREFKLNDIENKKLAYLTNTRQISLAKEAQKHLKHIIEENQKNVPVDILAIEIREVWEKLGKIIGEYYEEELIDNIFKRFCLGK